MSQPGAMGSDTPDNAYLSVCHNGYTAAKAVQVPADTLGIRVRNDSIPQAIVKVCMCHSYGLLSHAASPPDTLSLSIYASKHVVMTTSATSDATL